MSRKPRIWQDVLVYKKGNKTGQGTLNKYYLMYLEEMGLLPIRCGIEGCAYNLPQNKPMWNGKPLGFILDHIRGTRDDNRPENLRYVCPNCNYQLPTTGGKLKGRVKSTEGGYSILSEDRKSTHYYTIVEPAKIKISMGKVSSKISKS